MNTDILVVDDDTNICQLIKLYLEKEGFNVSICNSGIDALEEAKSMRFSLVLLDIMMPDIDGYETLKRLREFSNVPVIMISAKSETSDKITGLDFGADDYITKPFEPMELVSRVKAILRRSQANFESEDITLGNLFISLRQYNVTVGGVRIEMPPKEIEVLNCLAKNPNKVMIREELLNQVWGQDYKGDSRTVDVHIKRIREKLINSTARLVTVWGVGYKIEVDLD